MEPGGPGRRRRPREDRTGPPAWPPATGRGDGAVHADPAGRAGARGVGCGRDARGRGRSGCSGRFHLYRPARSRFRAGDRAASPYLPRRAVVCGRLRHRPRRLAAVPARPDAGGAGTAGGVRAPGVPVRIGRGVAHERLRPFRKLIARGGASPSADAFPRRTLAAC
ncbi:protein of unknown function [Microbacterium sp. Nx66]|nr:protein of unknown function [Microbacterium sp. Nx66]